MYYDDDRIGKALAEIKDFAIKRDIWQAFLDFFDKVADNAKTKVVNARETPQDGSNSADKFRGEYELAKHLPVLIDNEINEALVREDEHAEED